MIRWLKSLRYDYPDKTRASKMSKSHSHNKLCSEYPDFVRRSNPCDSRWCLLTGVLVASLTLEFLTGSADRGTSNGTSSFRLGLRYICVIEDPECVRNTLSSGGFWVQQHMNNFSYMDGGGFFAGLGFSIGRDQNMVSKNLAIANRQALSCSTIDLIYLVANVSPKCKLL